MGMYGFREEASVVDCDRWHRRSLTACKRWERVYRGAVTGVNMRWTTSRTPIVLPTDPNSWNALIMVQAAKILRDTLLQSTSLVEQFS